LHETKLDDELRKGHNNYLNFIHTMTYFILNFFINFDKNNLSEEELLAAEKQMTHSLLLIEKLLMYLFYSSSVYENYLSETEHIQFYNHADSKSLVNLLLKLQELINDYPYIQKDYKDLCEKTVDQILNYYPQRSIKIIVSPLPPPWKPNLGSLEQ